MTALENSAITIPAQFAEIYTGPGTPAPREHDCHQIASSAPIMAATMLRYLDQIALSLRPASVTAANGILRGFGGWIAANHPEVIGLADGLSRRAFPTPTGSTWSSPPKPRSSGSNDNPSTPATSTPPGGQTTKPGSNAGQGPSPTTTTSGATGPNEPASSQPKADRSPESGGCLPAVQALSVLLQTVWPPDFLAVEWLDCDGACRSAGPVVGPGVGDIGALDGGRPVRVRWPIRCDLTPDSSAELCQEIADRARRTPGHTGAPSRAHGRRLAALLASVPAYRP